MFAGGPAECQVIRGTVYDSLGAQPIVGARLTIAQGDSVFGETQTNALGFYQLAVPGPGTYLLTVEHFGFESKPSPVQIGDGETREFDISLRPAAFELEALLVEARPERGRDGFERRRSSGTGTFFDGIEIALQGRDRTLQLMATAPGFVVDFDQTLRPLALRGCLVVFLDHYRYPILYTDGSDPRNSSRRVIEDYRQPVRLAFGGYYSDLRYVFSRMHVRGIEMYRSITDIPEEIRKGPRFWELRPLGRGCGAIYIWTNDAW